MTRSTGAVRHASSRVLALAIPPRAGIWPGRGAMADALWNGCPAKRSREGRPTPYPGSERLLDSRGKPVGEVLGETDQRCCLISYGDLGCCLPRVVHPLTALLAQNTHR